MPRVFCSQYIEVSAHQFAAILFLESKPDLDFPSSAPQLLRGNQRITGIMTFSRKNDTRPGLRKKFRDRPSDACACLVH